MRGVYLRKLLSVYLTKLLDHCLAVSLSEKFSKTLLALTSDKDVKCLPALSWPVVVRDETRSNEKVA